MPLYSYDCDRCDSRGEQIVPFAGRNEPPDKCCPCGGTWVYGGLQLCAVGKREYQMAAILGDGRHVPGHFGKSAKRRPRRR